MVSALMCLGAFSLSPAALAVLDKDNQGRWTNPTVHNEPDKEVPGFLVNLGPTGARAVLTERTFIVKYIFNGYGPMQYTTILAVTAWQLVERCGVDVNPECIKRAMGFIPRHQCRGLRRL
jgi:hypothetical protein